MVRTKHTETVRKLQTAKKSTSPGKLKNQVRLQTKTSASRPCNNVTRSVKVKPKRRFRPGTLALREIRKYQKTTELLIQKLPFQRLVREITQKIDCTIRYKCDALSALQVYKF